MAAATYLLLSLFPIIDRGGSLAARLDAYMSIVRSVMIAILFQYYVTLAFTFGLLSGNIAYLLSFPHVPIGIFFILMGNHLPQLKPNHFAGIRTPWTLKDDGVWRKTNRVGGYFAIITGIFIILSPLFLQGKSLILGLIAIPPIFGLLLALYSYWLHRSKAMKGQEI